MTHGPDPRSLTPGVLDGAAENAFARGACSALAIAMHDALGGSALHWTVRRPDGLLVDVLGAHEPDRLVADYADEADDAEAAWGLSSRADALEWYAEGAGSAIPLGLARTFVDAVVERAATRPANRVGPEDGDPRP
jgi:hypothetical protein